MEDLKQTIKVIKALSDESRLRIIALLDNRQDICVCEITAIIGLSQPTISSHLKLLEDAGLIDHKKDGLWVNYRLAAGDNSPYAANLLGNLRHWLQDDPKIEELVERLPTIDREEVCKR